MQLNTQQELAANHKNGPCLVVAVPGSGKTRVLVERTVRLIRSGINPSDIISLTFTNKAAKEMKERIILSLGHNNVRMFCGTFHSLCAKMLRQFGSYVDLSQNFSILDSGEQKDLMNKIIKQKYLDHKNKIKPEDLSETINTIREDLVDFVIPGVLEEEFMKICDDESIAIKCADVVNIYLDNLKRYKCVDFSGLLYDSIRLLQNHDIPRDFMQGCHKYLQVDEVQDTNFAQFTLIKLLSEKHRNTFVVGDTDQSIYGWRGARYENVEDFINENKDISIIKLTYNYRSTPQIVKIADNLIKKNQNRIDKVFETVNVEGSPVVYNAFSDPEQEANYIANKIIGLVSTSDLKPNNFVILYRTNFMSRTLEEICMRMGIAYKVVGGFSFYERSEIKDCIAMLRLYSNKKDLMAFSRVSNLLNGVGTKTIAKIEEVFLSEKVDFMEACSKVYKKLSPKPQESVEMLINAFALCKETEVAKILNHIIRSLHYEDILNNSSRKDIDDRIENVYEFMRSLSSDENKKLTVDEFLQKISLVTSSDDSGEKNQITLMTLHAAKGLEFPVVFIVGVEKDILPHIRSMTEEGGIEEERRLFYVGMTRAKKKLFISSCKRRKIGGFGNDWKTCQPSPFLKEAELIK